MDIKVKKLIKANALIERADQITDLIEELGKNMSPKAMNRALWERHSYRLRAARLKA